MGFYDQSVMAVSGEEISMKDYKNNPEIKWSFTKFVVDRSGTVVARFEPTEKMENVDKCVEGLL